MTPKETNPNDAAFSRSAFYNEYKGTLNDAQEGLTKREYFALKAMQALFLIKVPKDTWKDVARESIRLADALIEELNKEQQ